MVAINTFAQLLPRKYDSADFREAMQAALRTDPAAYMEARRRRFDYCRELDLLLGQLCVAGLHLQERRPQS